MSDKKRIRGNPNKLIPLNKRTKQEQSEIIRLGGIASGVARRAKKHSREAAILLASLPVTENIKESLIKIGIPENEQNNQMAIMAALFRKSLSGDAAAVKLFLEITGEPPATELNISGNMQFNSGGLKQTLEALNKKD